MSAHSGGHQINYAQADNAPLCLKVVTGAESFAGVERAEVMMQSKATINTLAPRCPRLKCRSVVKNHA